MATPNDIIRYQQTISELDDVNDMIYIGTRESGHKNASLVIDCELKTLDFNPEYNPDYICDLNSEVYDFPNTDLIVCANTLMYVPNAYIAIDKLLSKTNKYLIIQEPVQRARTEIQQEYKDINRFYCKKYHTEPVSASLKVLEEEDGSWQKNFINLDRPELIESIYYPNPQPHVGGIWTYQK